MAKPAQQPRTLTRAEIIDAMVEKAGAPRADATRVLEAMLQQISDALVEGDTVKLARFGNFQARRKSERVGRNPKTGEEVPITPRRVVTFRPSQVLRTRVERPPVRAGRRK